MYRGAEWQWQMAGFGGKFITVMQQEIPRLFTSLVSLLQLTERLYGQLHTFVGIYFCEAVQHMHSIKGACNSKTNNTNMLYEYFTYINKLQASDWLKLFAGMTSHHMLQLFL